MLNRKRYLLITISSVILSVIAYLYDIQPRLEQIAQLKQSEETIKEKINVINFQPQNNIPNKTVDYKNKLNNMNELAAFINAHGLIIQAMDVTENNKPPDSILVHFTLRGNYQQLSALLYALDQQESAITLQNFSYKWIEQNILLITLDLLSLGRIQNTYHIAETNHFDPFCTSKNMNKWATQNDLNAALSAPLKTIKMIGYLQLGTHKQALMLLPNTLMRTVESGSLLGSERGVVVSVNHDKTVIKLSNERLVVLNR